MSEIPEAPSAPREARPFSVSGLLEALIGLCVVAAGALTLKAGHAPSSEVAQQSPAGLFFRKVLMGNLHPGADGSGGHHVKYWLILAALAAVLLVQLVWPKLRAEARTMTAAVALMFLLVPVLNYGPQIDRLSMAADDAAVLANRSVEQVKADPAYNSFKPVLPVTLPLVLAGLLALAWAVITPPDEWPSTFVAGGFTLLLFVLGGRWLLRGLLLARGQALQLDYNYWPQAVAALWVVGQLLTTATAAAIAGRQAKGSRWLAGATLLLLAATVVMTRGGR